MLITLGSHSISSPAACAICTQITPLSCILQKREMKEECILPCLGDTWLLIWSSKSYLYISKDVKNNTCSKTCYTAARNSGKSSTSLPFFDMLGKTLLSKTRCCWSIDILHGLDSVCQKKIAISLPTNEKLLFFHRSQILLSPCCPPITQGIPKSFCKEKTAAKRTLFLTLVLLSIEALILKQILCIQSHGCLYGVTQ